ncbi:DUF3035 domain-containing protein [Kamptonema cortianum]|nr:DUF3035 domain-containing protein [Geitlerinema splendidum]MDK3155074.1 DUF3035 domain-containing protein [Kamptonema cortianum]
MIHHSRFTLIALLSGCCLLQACGSVKKTLGIDRAPPDEFAVTPTDLPLEMPPEILALPELPKPDPGAPRPQDIKALEEKRNQVLGIKPQNHKASKGEQNILQQAGAEPGQKELRKEIDEESRIEEAKGSHSVLQSLGIKKKKLPGEVVNPYEEAAELQKKGIPQNQNVVPQ